MLHLLEPSQSMLCSTQTLLAYPTLKHRCDCHDCKACSQLTAISHTLASNSQLTMWDRYC